MELPNLPIIELNMVDSTNNYAMQLIDDNKARHGLTIVAQSQSAGKGQRGKAWMDAPGQSLLMSMIIMPQMTIAAQFEFNALVTVAIANVLQKLINNLNFRIKWPNDIIVNDKKAGGILIENILRGHQWTHSVVGIGLNIKQESFPESLPLATSLKIASGIDFDITLLRDFLRSGILESTGMPQHTAAIMKAYNAYLYKRGSMQFFSDSTGRWEATILEAHADGMLEVELADGRSVRYYHGQVGWEWGA